MLLNVLLLGTKTFDHFHELNKGTRMKKEMAEEVKIPDVLIFKVNSRSRERMVSITLRVPHFKEENGNFIKAPPALKHVQEGDHKSALLSFDVLSN